jgi:glycosyltransferase involved in cell wall biosynthesis
MSMPGSLPATILFAIPSMVLGGSERVVLNLLRHINAERFQSHVVVLERDGTWLENVPPYIRVHELGVHRARQAVLPFARLCHKIKPRAVLSTSAHLNTAVIAARPLLPLGTSLLTREGADLAASCGGIRLSIYKQVYSRADRVICQSDYMKENLIRQLGLAPDKVVRIYNPVDIKAISALADSIPSPFSEAGPNLVGVGRISYEKGFDLLLRCMPLIRQAAPTAAATLIGEGPDLKALMAIVRDLQLECCVRFVGLHRNPFPFIKHADLVVLPSRTEALPNVVLEAIALGTPVVATNCTGALREISSCSARLRVANGATVTALAAEIISALVGRTARLEVGPEPQFEARFGVHAVTQQYESILTHSMRERTPDACRRVDALA